MAAQDLTEEIRQRAYDIWMNEGRPHGRDRIHWLRAEAECRDKLTVPELNLLEGLHERPSERPVGKSKARQRARKS